MNATAIAMRRASELRDAGRQPDLPFAVSLSDGSTVEVVRLLRVLPGKRIVGEGLWQGQRVLVKLFLDRRSEQRWAQEKSGLAVLVQAGIATPELLYAAALPGGGHVLLTAFLDAAETLAECWAPMSDRPADNPEAITLLCFLPPNDVSRASSSRMPGFVEPASATPRQSSTSILT